MSVIVITGASGGIGCVTAEAASIQGYSVAVNYLKNKSSANWIVNKIKKKGGKAIAIQADVSTETGVKKLFKKVDQELGTLTALFANAGIIHENYNISEYTSKRVFQVSFPTDVQETPPVPTTSLPAPVDVSYNPERYQ